MDSTAKHDSAVIHDTGLQEYLRILYRRRYWVIGIFSIFMGLGIFYLLTATPIYKAKCKLLVNTSSSVRMGISAADVMSDVLGAGRGRSLETQVELIQSEKIYGKAIMEMGYADMMKAPGIIVEGLENTDVLTISCSSPDRKEAVKVANGVAATYIKYSKDRGTYALDDAVESLTTESKKAMAEVQQAADELEAFHKMTNGQTRPEAVTALLTKSDALRTEQIKATTELKASRAQLEKLKNELGVKRDFIVQARTVTENPAIAEIRKRLGIIQGERAQATGEFQPGSTRLKDLDNQIKILNDQMKAETSRIVTSEALVNPVEQKLLDQFVGLQVTVQGLEQRQKAATASLQQHEAMLASMPANERLATELQLRLTIAQEKYRLLEQKLQEAKTTLAIKKPSKKAGIDAQDAPDAQAPVEIIQAATDPLAPSSPRKKRVLLMVFMLGLLFGVAVALVVDFLDDTFVGVEEIENNLALQVIGAAPKQPPGEPVILSSPMGQTALAEAFRGIRSHLRWCNDAGTSQVMTIISPISQDGRSTIAANLAIAFAESNVRTLLVDADMRNPKLHEYLGMGNDKAGLAQCLANGSDPANVLQATPYRDLNLLAAGGHPVGPSELLDSPNMQQLVKRLRELADVVIIDTPPAELLSDAWIVARLSDVVLPVVRMDKVKRPVAERMSMLLKRENMTTAGVIINRFRLTGGQAATKRLRDYLNRTNGNGHS